MKLIINASTLSASGVTQVATSFIYECINIEENEYHVFLSNTVDKQIDKDCFPSNFTFYRITSHPLYGLDGFKTRKKLKNLELIIKPDCVFSVFGPSWWSPRVPHLQGFAYGHYVYGDSPFYEKISCLQKIKISLYKKIHLFFLQRNGNYFVSETQDVSLRLKNILVKGEFFTANNTHSNIFNTFDSQGNKLLPPKKKNEFRFISLCTYDEHKNLTVLNKVIPLLNQIENNISFVLTISNDIFEKKFSDEAKKSMTNLGRIAVNECPQLYFECDALFLPTTIECFSGNYPEAMKMRRPILTSNLSFATSICGDAALYFDPYNEKEIVKTIMKIIDDQTLRETLINNGIKKLDKFLNSKQRAEKYIRICENIGM